MMPFQGAGAGQAIEVSIRIFGRRQPSGSCALGARGWPHAYVDGQARERVDASAVLLFKCDGSEARSLRLLIHDVYIPRHPARPFPCSLMRRHVRNSWILTAPHATQDAYILSALLTHPHTTLRTLTQATAIYDAVRRPFAQRIAELSREAGILYTLNYPGLTFPDRRDRGKDKDRLEAIYERIRANWSWAWETTADSERERAVAMLEGRC